MTDYQQIMQELNIENARQQNELITQQKNTLMAQERAFEEVIKFLKWYEDKEK